MPTTRSHYLLRIVVLAFIFIAARPTYASNALERYVEQPDDSFAWEVEPQTAADDPGVTHITMTSQTWRGHVWTHTLTIVRPQALRHPDTALLLIAGDHSGPGSHDALRAWAARAGALVVELTRVPNQPFYDGRKEDALIAYTFEQYLRTGDETWPALFPMTKAAVRAMDTVQAWANQRHLQKFLVAGASKRGWTTWLTAAVDGRVTAIAPMIIDMLNMKAQAEWAEQVYGAQSDKVSDYSGLIKHIDSPPVQKLRSWVDPYSYRARYRLPKLLLLGTNDPYWTVDSLRHYWDDLPGPKLLFQTPNGGHAVSKEASETLAAFFEMIADEEELPDMDWHIGANGQGLLSVHVNRPAQAIHVWTADSATRDFRQAQWTSRPLAIRPGSSHAVAEVEQPGVGYRAFMGEVVLTSSSGYEYKLSTEVQVLPDDVK